MQTPQLIPFLLLLLLIIIIIIIPFGGSMRPQSTEGMGFVPSKGMEELSFFITDGDSSSGRLVAKTESHSYLRVYKPNFQNSDSDYACRQMGFRVGYMSRRYFGFTSYHNSLRFLKNQICLDNGTIVCYAIQITEVKHLPPASEDVTVRCLKDYEVQSQPCTSKKSTVQFLFCEVPGRECGSKYSQVFMLLMNEASYVVGVNCTGVLAGTTTMYSCSSTDSCHKKLNLLCAEPCQFTTSAWSGRIFFDESMIDKVVKITNQCKVSVRLSEDSYVVISISRMKLRSCQELYIEPRGNCFGELYLSDGYQESGKQHFRLFECNRFSVILDSSCTTYGSSHFDIHYNAEFYASVKPISLVHLIGNQDFSFSCGFYYQNLSDHFLYMSLVNLSKPYTRWTIWSFEDLEGKEIIIKNSSLRDAVDKRMATENYTFGLSYFRKSVTRDHPPRTYAGTYNCRQNVIHGYLSHLDWNAELILFTDRGECVLEQFDIPGVKIVMATCRIPYYGRFAPVATFYAPRFNMSQSLILNGTTRFTAEYHLMLLFDSLDPLEGAILQEWHINSPQGHLTEVHCKLFFVQPRHNPPSSLELLPCYWPTKNATVVKGTEQESKFFIMVVIMAVSLVLPFVNFLTMCLWSVVQKKTLKRSNRLKVRRILKPRLMMQRSREFVASFLVESREMSQHRL